MKKIEFDEEFGTVLLEPGVGFYDLYDYIQANNLPYWLSTPGNSWGSVIGNALDRGVGYTPYGENTKNLCGLEVVLPTGEVVRTGMGAFTNAPTWGAYPYGFGPGWDQMFVQSNFGVVTKANMWLMPEPESLMGMDVEFDKPEDLKAMVDTIGPLRRERVLQQSPVDRQLAARRGGGDHARRMDRQARRARRQRDRRDPQALRPRLVGRRAAHLRARGGQQGGLRGAREGDERDRPAGHPPDPLGQGPADGILGAGPAPRSPSRCRTSTGTAGAAGTSASRPIIPQSGSAALEQFQRTYARYKEYGMDYQGSFAFGERHLTNVNAMLFNKDDPGDDGRGSTRSSASWSPTPRSRATASTARTSTTWTWSPGATTGAAGRCGKLNEKVKDALDPNGILAPGKSGIWPKGAEQRAGMKRRC